jgi:hypothetical protein
MTFQTLIKSQACVARWLFAYTGQIAHHEKGRECRVEQEAKPFTAGRRVLHGRQDAIDQCSQVD